MEELMQEPAMPAFDILAEKYWLAAPAYSKEFATEVLERVKESFERWETSSLAQALWRAYRMYHNLGEEAELGGPDTTIMEAGEQGELLSLRINQFRNIVRHQLTIATGQRPAWDPQARTSGAEAAKQVQLTRSILDYAHNFKGCEGAHAQSQEIGVVLAESYIVIGWDPNAGYGGSGDAWVRTFMPHEVTRPVTRFYDDTNWWIVRKPENRWDWVAHFKLSDPEKAEAIAEVDCTGLAERMLASSTVDRDSEDQIPVWYVLAKPSRALPQGRMALVTVDDIVLYDGPYPFGDADVVIRVCPYEFLGTSVGYSDSWTLMVVNDAYNAVISTMLTRADAFGIPNVSAVEGTEIEVQDIAGLNIIKHPPGQQKPEVLDLFSIPSEFNALLEMLGKLIETLGGVNSVARGAPAQNITSGSMAALVEAMSVRYNSPLERCSNQTWEKLGTALVKVYQRMATEEQVISIAGKDQAWTAKQFKGADIADIMAVTIKQVSAMAKSTAGRADIADKLLANDKIEDPREYLSILATGNIEPFFAGPVNFMSTIQSENEAILQGETPKAIELEPHILHIREHMAAMDHNARQRPEVLAAYNAHVMEHFQLMNRMSREASDLLVAIGTQPLPEAAAMGQAIRAMQGMAGGQPGGGPPPQKVPNSEEPPKAPPRGPAPAPGAGNEVPGRMPKMPEPAEPPKGAAG